MENGKLENENEEKYYCGSKSCKYEVAILGLVEDSKRNKEAHREMYDNLHRNDIVIAETRVTLNAIIEKLDKLTVKVDELTEKPAKNWEMVIGCIISAVVAYIIATILK